MIRDQDLEFFRPASRRYGITLFLVAWTGYEWFVVGSPFWGTLTAALALYCYNRLIRTFPEDGQNPEK